MSQFDFSAMDHDVLAYWRDSDVFARSLAQTAGGPRWVFYEGPPTANGLPGVHHVEARVFKDVFPRFKTMKGFHVPRRAGWDCHGLPVEIAVEKELGLSGKQDIERVGIAEFNARCRESVQRHVDEFVAMTERAGYWVDMSEAYWTMSPEYVDSVWWALKQIHTKGLLAEDYRVSPYCPRCGTGLSDHEVAQGYETVTDPSVYVRFPTERGFDLLVWTTTPWTLVANTAVAVHPDVSYVVARTADGTFVVAEPLLKTVLGEGAEVLETMQGRDLEHLRYQRPFDLVEIPDAHYVVLGDYVTTEDGTGLVHQAPAFGAEDLATCRKYGLPVVNPIGPDGRFHADIPLVGGLFFKDANDVLLRELQPWRLTEFEHSYPHCWRCHTPLLYYAQLSWYIRTTQIRDALLRENERTGWHPAHIKHGRFGDWLQNNVDWALSRNRYWGTPLPLWRCANGHVTCVGSRAELGHPDLDPHRPFIDEITLDCPQCSATAHRVPEVIDAWFDSGAMPFAQVGYPYLTDRLEYPADFIAEAIDQTRGWFYTLMAVGTLVFDESSYKDVLCLGHIMAEDGRKMSKHLGNVIEPIPFMDKHGADAVRWFMLCSGSPWGPRRVGDAALEEIVRRVLLTYLNTTTFFSLYATAPTTATPELTPLDRWLRAELHHLVGVVESALDGFDTAGAGRALSEFIDDLSNWYVRLSRSRFWAGDPAAIATLREALDVLTRLMAPLTPFVTEHVWRTVLSAPDSVHLASWPKVDVSALDDELRAQMATVRALVEAGRAARKAANLRVRQPLAQALISAPVPAELVGYIADELNVRAVSPLDSVVVDTTVKPNFRALGQRFGSRTQQVAAAITATDPRAFLGAEPVMLATGDTVTAQDVFVTQTPRAGWAVGTARDVTIALDTELTEELQLAGLAREVIRLVQDARKQAGFAITDRIRLRWNASGQVAEAVTRHTGEIAAATLATLSYADELESPHTDEELGLKFRAELES